MASSVRRLRIYTRSGDRGKTSLFNGSRVPKSDHTVKALGDTDELNAHLGVAHFHCTQVSNGLSSHLHEIQSRLLDLSSCIATPLQSTQSTSKLRRTKFAPRHVVTLETWIDELDANLPPLKNFILPVCWTCYSFVFQHRVCWRFSGIIRLFIIVFVSPNVAPGSM